MGLSIKKIEKLTKPGRYHDGRGLYLQVKSSTNRSWVFRFTKEGRERWMGLGPLHVFTLEEARSRARKVHQQLADGIDPLAERQKEETERKAAEADLKARAVTFRKAAQEYYDRNHIQWRNLKHRAQFLSTMETYAYPKLGELVVGAIVRKHVVEVLEHDDFWTQKPVTADRVRSRIELVLDYATARDWREGPNPAKWKGNLASVLPDRNELKSENHHAALRHPVRQI